MKRKLPQEILDSAEKEFYDTCGPFIIKIVKKRKLKQKLSRSEIKMEAEIKWLMEELDLESVIIDYNDGIADRQIVYSITK